MKKTRSAENCYCGGKITTKKTLYLRGVRMVAFPSHPCDKCNMLYWEDSVPVQCHADDGLMFAFVTETSHEYREVSPEFLRRMK